MLHDEIGEGALPECQTFLFVTFGRKLLWNEERSDHPHNYHHQPTLEHGSLPD